ncbi:MAG: hypothetical protein K9J17_09660 [Flavobacteriales bacterium]|nr:hypothetical protein [Flavobacteriales bacterium]
MDRHQSFRTLAVITILIGAFLLNSQSIGQSKKKQKERDPLEYLPQRSAASVNSSSLEGLPRDWSWVPYKGQGYFFGDGQYHVRDGDSTFKKVDPPIGIRILCLPIGYRIIKLGEEVYYLYQGVFYQTTLIGEFEVVSFPMGTLVTELPPNSHRVVIDGAVYWYSEGVYYKELANDLGGKEYQVKGLYKPN